MSQFALALAAFVILHVGVSATGLRARLVGRIGEGPYRGLFSLASAGVLIWLVAAFNSMRATPYDPLNAIVWLPSPALHGVALVLVALGFLLAVPGLLTRNPTLAGMEGALNRADVATGILRVTRHPFLWGVAFWALGHLLANGERFALMLFGALGLMVLLGTRSIDRKGRARSPQAWARYEAVTSNIPFAAILQGRNKLVIGEMWWRLLAAAAIYLLVGYAHGAVFGVPVFTVPA